MQISDLNFWARYVVPRWQSNCNTVSWERTVYWRRICVDQNNGKRHINNQSETQALLTCHLSLAHWLDIFNMWTGISGLPHLFNLYLGNKVRTDMQKGNEYKYKYWPCKQTGKLRKVIVGGIQILWTKSRQICFQALRKEHFLLSSWRNPYPSNHVGV